MQGNGQVQFRRDPDAIIAVSVGAPGELFVSTDSNRVYAQDGQTIGGYQHALTADFASGLIPALFASVTATGFIKSGNAVVVMSANPQFTLNKTTTSPSTANGSGKIVGYQNGVPRWAVEIGNSNEETGGGVGSDFVIDRFSDNGTFLDMPISISRATGAIVFGSPAAVAFAGPLADQSKQDVAPASTNFSYLIPNNCKTLLIKPTGVFAAGAVTMCPNPIDGQEARVCTLQTVTALTVNANAGQSISGAPTSITPSTPFTMAYDLASTTWFRAG